MLPGVFSSMEFICSNRSDRRRHGIGFIGWECESNKSTWLMEHINAEAGAQIQKERELEQRTKFSCKVNHPNWINLLAKSSWLAAEQCVRLLQSDSRRMRCNVFSAPSFLSLRVWWIWLKIFDNICQCRRASGILWDILNSIKGDHFIQWNSKDRYVDCSFRFRNSKIWNSYYSEVRVIQHNAHIYDGAQNKKPTISKSIVLPNEATQFNRVQVQHSNARMSRSSNER